MYYYLYYTRRRREHRLFPIPGASLSCGGHGPRARARGGHIAMRRRPSRGIPHTILALSFIIYCVVVALPGSMPAALAATGWQQQVSGTTNTLTGVSAVDANTAWAVGLGGTVLKTTNGGTTWTPQVPGTGYAAGGVAAVNKDVAWAWSRANGAQAYKTIDGGATWQVAFTPQANENCVWISPVGVNTAYLMVVLHWTSYDYTYGAVRMWKTTDGGATWSVQYYGPATVSGNSLGSVSAVNANTAWAVNSYAILKTTDGTSWTQQFTSSHTLYSVSAVDTEVAWAAGDSVIYKTTNGGVTWTPVLERPLELSCILASTADVSVAVGSDYSTPDQKGVICRTIDGGVTWNQQAVSETFNLLGLAGVDANTYWAVGGYGLVLHTTDGGGLPAVVSPVVTSINPASGVNNANYAVEVLGSGFQSGATAMLVQGSTLINGTSVVLTGPGRLTCYFDLTNRPLGKYDLLVKNPDNQEGKLSGGFSVTDPCGQGGGASIAIFAGLVGLLSLAGFGMGWKHRGPTTGRL
jgi:photosystem II stability/assembly factor-like uncharacterized protein